jgi:hypothetical protein
MKGSIRIFLLSYLMVCTANAQMGRPWNGRMCAVVLTYDDGLNGMNLPTTRFIILAREDGPAETL